MHVSMYGRYLKGRGFEAIQEWPSKSRLFRSQSIDSEKKNQKNTQNTNKDCDVEHLNRASGIMWVFYAK